MKAFFANRHLAVFLLAFVTLTWFASLWWAASGMTQLTDAWRRQNELPANLPTLSRRVTPYSTVDYQKLIDTLQLPQRVLAENKNTHILLVAISMDEEKSWRSAVAELLALDSNLKVQRICGGSACAGRPLLAEIGGNRVGLAIDSP